MKGKDFILKENTEEIREKIKAAGIHVCGCAWFKDACWLWYSPELLRSVHGVRYFADDDKEKNQEEYLKKSFLSILQNPIICDNVEEFIARIKQSQN